MNELVEPNHSRETLMKTLASSDAGEAAGSIYSQTHVSTIRDLCLVPMKMRAPDDSSWGLSLSRIAGPNPDDRTQFVTLCLKREIIGDMRRRAAESGALAVCSTFDVLAARVWKVCSATKARCKFPCPEHSIRSSILLLFVAKPSAFSDLEL